jgi:hypothetical protein
MLIAFNKEEFLIKKKKVKEGETERGVSSILFNKNHYFSI